MIKQAYLAQLVQQGASLQKAEDFWLQIETAYTGPDRFFHDLAHLEQIYKELIPHQQAFADWPTAFFALCYHDFVYDVEQHTVLNDNEERSADVAEMHLSEINYPSEKIQRCREQILATKHTETPQEPDTCLVADADLSILGQPWEVYQRYKNHIRQEYSSYPDNIYQAGRRKILHTFLQKEPLFSTPQFFSLYEKRARENMQRELQLLHG